MKRKKIMYGLIAIFFAILLVYSFAIKYIGNADMNTVVIFTSMEDYRNQDLEKMVKEKFPDLNVKVQYLSTGNSAAKIKAEGKSTEADIIVDLERAHAENLKENFMDLSSIDKSMYLDGINPDHNKYLVWVKYSASFIVNTEVIEEKGLAIPKTYEDLLKPEYKGLIAMPDPKVSGTGYMVLKNIVNIMGEEEGLQYFDKLQENVKEFTASGSGPVKLLNQKEIAIGIGMTTQAVTEINKGSPFEVIIPETGAPYNSTTTAVIDGKQQNPNVMKVFDWLITDFSKYDKKMYMPEQVLKNQEVDVANFPKDISYGDMTGIDNSDEKENLTKKWKY